ncbi:Asp23/Gls24 family envelope stress response protein [Candidatus Acetothermia bacterium]|jgi:uncharacterized alkaline shock family protein YloU|nr:Asp23/Gls24 family envelope stress response protein [Candidatus Acetothermia bacterium]MCI2427449.1 Asp23/Gls24 family envelope stress response protein [Candidatus Acetothermia bacterium]MCI2428572.1 Asp23/Gls24 family envelope stress response protein [Candidatus Acetothermia bacterium]
MMGEKTIEINDVDGRITISNDVLTAIAKTAAEQVDGVVLTQRRGVGGIMGLFGGEDPSPTVSVETSDNDVKISITIMTKYGDPVHQVAQGVQENVKADIERLTGVAVSSIDVYVTKVVPASDNVAVEAAQGDNDDTKG